MEINAGHLVYPLAYSIRRLEVYLSRQAIPVHRSTGDDRLARATVAAIEALESAERAARLATPFDPTGL